jgi:hypothetical protein
MMRHTLATAIETENRLEEAGLVPERNVFRKTNTLLRVINVLFHSENVDHFLHLNDNHNRAHYEQKRTFNDFWKKVLEHYNVFEKEDEELLSIQMIEGDSDRHLVELKESGGINLKHADSFDMPSLRTKVKDLFKTRALVKSMMTKSGTHSNDPWDFMQAACAKVHSITIDAAYYFHVRCEEHADIIDAEFQVFMDQEIKGSSEDIGPGLFAHSAAAAVPSATSSLTWGSKGNNKQRSVEKFIEEFQDFKRITTEQGTDRKKMVDTQVTIKNAVLLEKKLQYASKKLEQAQRNNDDVAIQKYEAMVTDYEEELFKLS